MAERLKNSGFWTCRFLVTPEELKSWACYTNENMGIYLGDGDGGLDSSDVCNTLFESYQTFYDGLTSCSVEQRNSPHIRVWLNKDGFNSSIYLQKQKWYFDPPNTTRVSRDFYLELVSPKGYQVNDPDGIHYDYFDIHEIEPLAKEIFNTVTLPIKKLTKPLLKGRYGTGKLVPEYQIRISEQAWADLKNSKFICEIGQNLNTNW
jgi:hypothetical protein